MDWTNKINLAIDYMENNLEGKFDIKATSKVAYSSTFHFQRMFHAIIGITPAEYVRRRKLSLAAMELASGNVKVIEVVSKYGFDSPNAFTRAFRNIHHINPSEVYASKIKLSVYPRESCQLEINGDSDMRVNIIKKPAFDVIGKGKTFEFDKFMKEAPKFWKKYVATQDYQSLCSLNNGRSGTVSEAPLMSVYIPSDNGDRSLFTDVLAIEKSAEIGSLDFKLFHIPSATYAEFNCLYNAAAKMNKYIYGEWFSSTGYKRDGDKADIAAYFPVPFRPMKDMRVRWWIPIVE